MKEKLNIVRYGRSGKEKPKEASDRREREWEIKHKEKNLAVLRSLCFKWEFGPGNFFVVFYSQKLPPCNSAKPILINYLNLRDAYTNTNSVCYSSIIV